jgi:hypothetical protein
MTVHGTVAALGGASTVSDHRATGAQSALLHHRLRAAADTGCRIAVATAAPDGYECPEPRPGGDSPAQGLGALSVRKVPFGNSGTQRLVTAASP